MKKLLVLPLAFAAALAGGTAGIVQDVCGPFTDVSPAFCPFVLELYYLGITAGTSATTYSPDDPLTRGQAAVFVAKGLNQSLARSSRRAALGQWWTTTPAWQAGLGTTLVGDFPFVPAADGADIWVPASDATISRVRASDGRLLETWTGADGPGLVAMGRVFVATQLPATLTMLDPALPAGTVTEVASDIGTSVAQALAFDGERIWASTCCTITIPPNIPPPGSVSITTPGTWSSSIVTDGFSEPYGLVFDGTHMWVTDLGASAIFQLDSAGAIVQTIPTPTNPGRPAYDGANLWVPSSDGILVIRAATGDVVATVGGGGTVPSSGSAAFDGRRVLVVDGPLFSLWDAQSLTLIGTFETGYGFGFGGVCSDGINFWLTLNSSSGPNGVLARY